MSATTLLRKALMPVDRLDPVLWEYQLVVSMPESIKDRVRKLRQHFAVDYNLPAPSNEVMMPLLRFRQHIGMEDKVVRQLRQTVSAWRPAAIHIKNFAAQPTHAIYLPVTCAQHLQPLVRDLKQVQHVLRPDRDHQPFFTAEHKILLASKLPPEKYTAAWATYSRKHFTAQFMADACLLLKRRNGDRYWQIVQRMEWKDLPIGAMQTSLFG
ncbi:2'-5' RNA ligase family protein [Flavihumibacter petaseus]|uniref:2'-5' RNA ligase n=1 Tax=Flavihumibacter petaseus NBRC 106054 TaxID=1220578 RepID=A0A0E9N7D4_9BACT|nr:2'-5' RNA ligase family protein [Flavihumibacter petaseus]GAO45260.1 hypothetical protein FPE01S_04_05030 [Flavihumibacter petaseus NBRC 106054]